MSDIDDIIRRSREPGTFSERKEFTIAKNRAIEKMRKFALRTPSHYILELIQGAVANGATYLDIFIDNDTTRMAWTGGVFPLEELQQIFDYLFTDNQERKSAAIRQIAVGINALLAFRPEKIVIESGDGLAENSTRIEIDPSTMHITAGRPLQPLKGTFILAAGKKGKTQEEKLISERCLTLNIPIIVNNRILFGYSSVRSPNLFGVKKSLKFDEGDFYGTIGLSKGPNTDNFKILTHGVWIQTVKRDLGIPQTFGGIIALDHLNKTVDHSAIVEDEVWNEMWARVSLAARELISGTDRNKIVLKYKGEWTDLPTCRKKAIQAGGAILFRNSTVQEKLIPEYEKIYGFPGFIVGAKDSDFVSNLLGNQNLYLAEGTQSELEFLRKPKIEKPKGPFFLDPVDHELRAHPNISKITFYTPRAFRLTAVEFVESGRLSNAVELPNIALGFNVRIDLNTETTAFDMSTESAELLMRSYGETLHDLSKQIANEYASVIEPGTAAAFHVLRALASTTIFSIDGGEFSIRRLGLDTNKILSAPILKTMDDAPKSILDIVAMMNKQFGLVYGCVRGITADLENLNKSKILSLTPQEEREIIAIFGDAAYVRIDDRDVLASHRDKDGNTFTIRDIAVGLGAYDDKFILCENNENITLEISTILIDALKARVINANDDPELRRQSLRHLIWTLTHPNAPPALVEDLESFPLFRSDTDEIIGFNRFDEELKMLDGWPIGPIALPNMVGSYQPKRTKTLALNPFVFHMLSRKKKLTAQSDNPGTRADLRNSVLSSWVDSDTERGTISLMPRTASKSFSVINSATKQVHVHDGMAERLMCAGEFYTEKDEFLTDLFLVNCIQLFGKAARLINQSDDLSHIQSLAEPALFGALPLITARRISSFHRLETKFPQIENLLHCKIFPSRRGVPISATMLTQSFERPIQELDQNAPPYLIEWLKRILNSQFTGVVGEEEKADWKEFFFFPAMEQLSDKAWIISFLNQITNSSITFSESQSANLPLLEIRQAVVSVNLKRAAKFLAQHQTNDRVWLAMEIVTALQHQKRIGEHTAQKYHRQIANLVLEKKTTNIRG